MAEAMTREIAHTMTIFGLDFTSAPSRRKPITCAQCVLSNSQLSVLHCLFFVSFAEFEVFLQCPGPWIATCDFPFGQPLPLITDLSWPKKWAEHVRYIASLGKAGFTEMLAKYSASRPVGEKMHLRLTDKLARSVSPMMIYWVPVGKMFFEGAPRLLASGASILPCHPQDDTRIVLEGYPALVARCWLGKNSYKSDERKKQTAEQRIARQRLVSVLQSQELLGYYDIHLSLADDLATQMIDDPMADQLDAVLCAIQAAWAYKQRARNYGIPPGFELDGWIVDPTTLEAFSKVECL